MNHKFLSLVDSFVVLLYHFLFRGFDSWLLILLWVTILLKSGITKPIRYESSHQYYSILQMYLQETLNCYTQGWETKASGGASFSQVGPIKCSLLPSWADFSSPFQTQAEKWRTWWLQAWQGSCQNQKTCRNFGKTWSMEWTWLQKTTGGGNQVGWVMMHG